MLFKSFYNYFYVVLSSVLSGIILILCSWYALFTIPTKRHSVASVGVIKRMEFSIHSPYMSLYFSDCTAAKSSVSHDAFCGLQFVVAFELLMKKHIKEPFWDWCKSPSSVAIDNGTGVIGFWKASSRVNAFVMMVPKAWQFSFRISSYLVNLFHFLYSST